MQSYHKYKLTINLQSKGIIFEKVRDQPTDMDEYSKCLHLSLYEGSMKPAKLSNQSYHTTEITEASMKFSTDLES